MKLKTSHHFVCLHLVYPSLFVQSMMVLGERYFQGVVEGGESVGGSAQQNVSIRKV
jgi:hypothetical protein